FPATGGALYGRSNHGFMGTFERPASVSSMPGLYFVGGSVHPGAGVPMAVLSGRLCAERVVRDAAEGPGGARGYVQLRC
nr:FAD-dependent oxidoreductase [Myxococcaceae bacterium]